MDIEDKIAALIKEEYASIGFHDEGRATGAAHYIIELLANTDPQELQRFLAASRVL